MLRHLPAWVPWGRRLLALPGGALECRLRRAFSLMVWEARQFVSYMSRRRTEDEQTPLGFPSWPGNM